MKKTYIVPALEVLNVQMESAVLTTSFPIHKDETGADQMVKGEWQDIW